MALPFIFYGSSQVGEQGGWDGEVGAGRLAGARQPFEFAVVTICVAEL
jgi:hypothetical protein